MFQFFVGMAVMYVFLRGQLPPMVTQLAQKMSGEGGPGVLPGGQGLAPSIPPPVPASAVTPSISPGELRLPLGIKVKGSTVQNFGEQLSKQGPLGEVIGADLQNPAFVAAMLTQAQRIV